jgi:hypothetical protein
MIDDALNAGAHLNHHGAEMDYTYAGQTPLMHAVNIWTEIVYSVICNDFIQVGTIQCCIYASYAKVLIYR